MAIDPKPPEEQLARYMCRLLLTRGQAFTTHGEIRELLRNEPPALIEEAMAFALQEGWLEEVPCLQVTEKGDVQT